MKTRNGLQNCRTRRTLCTAVFDSILKKQFYLCATWSISRQSVKSAAESAAGTHNRRTEAYTRGFSVPSRTWRLNFAAPKNNACEIREDFRRRSNALHHPVIYRSVKLLHRTVAYPAVLYVLMPDDEADRVLLRTGHHERKSERICGTADFSPQSAHSPLTQKLISRKMEVKS